MRVDADGLGLNVERAGRPGAPPLLLLHGFTGSAAAWHDLVPALAATHNVLAVDLVGHGGSDAPAEPDRYRMERAVVDLLALLHALDVGRTVVLGYSLGGRVALHLAVAAPERVERLVLESASPGIEDPAERAARCQADDALANRLERDGLEAFVDYWERIPLFASQAALSADVRARLREQRLRGSVRGLANSLRGMGAGQPEPLWNRLPHLHVPALLVVGALDAKYREQGARAAALLPDARLVVVPDTGHTVHLEQPAAFRDLVLAFLAAPAPRLATSSTPGGPA